MRHITLKCLTLGTGIKCRVNIHKDIGSIPTTNRFLGVCENTVAISYIQSDADLPRLHLALGKCIHKQLSNNVFYNLDNWTAVPKMRIHHQTHHSKHKNKVLEVHVSKLQT